MKTFVKIAPLIAASLFSSGIAAAHVSVAGPAFANATWEATFTVGHGCEGNDGKTVDTYSVKIVIPAGVTSVRAVNGTLGNAVTEKDGSGNVTSITWTKPTADILASDDDFYRLPVRMKVPNTPFAKLYFPAYQVCRDTLGNVFHTDWVGTGDITALPDGAPPPEPAPSVVLLPARVPGWNKFTVGTKLTDLKIFNDAEIVWAGNAAYSVNPNYTAPIGTEPDTTALTEIAAGTDIWVKY